MKINPNKIIDDLKLTAYGGKGWLASPDLECPECKKKDKFGIKFTNNFGAVHCFKCEYSESIVKFLKRIGRNDLLDYEESVRFDNTLKPVFEDEEAEIVELSECKLPKGYERIYFDKYLNDRNFKAHQYDQYEVGITNHFLESRLKNYLIFVIRQEGKLVGWVARSKYSKEWHKKNLEAYKAGEGKLVQRYLNSTGTDFDKLLGGYDQVTDKTETAVLVEGIFDQTNTSNLLSAHKRDDLKVLCTFGNKVSQGQIELLRKTKIKKVILMYDEGTIAQSRKFGAELSRYFDVEVCVIEDPNVDPGDMDKKFLEELFFKSKNFTYFYNSKLNIKF